MDAIIWLIGIGLPIAALLFLFGYLKGLVDASAISSWGTGFDDGWKAHKEYTEEMSRIRRKNDG